MTEPKEPKGIVGILIDNTGYVRASATDFTEGGAAGFTEWQRQKICAKNRVAKEFISDHMMEDLADAINDHYSNAFDIVDRLIRDKGWRLHFVAIGYEGIDPNE